MSSRVLAIIVALMTFALAALLVNKAVSAELPQSMAEIVEQYKREPFSPPTELLTEVKVFASFAGRWVEVINGQGGEFRAQYVVGSTFVGYWFEHSTGRHYFAVMGVGQ